jgi:hypothetical protein
MTEYGHVNAGSASGTLLNHKVGFQEAWEFLHGSCESVGYAIEKSHGGLVLTLSSEPTFNPSFH